MHCQLMPLSARRGHARPGPAALLGGFTLTELAIVLLIASLLMGGMLVPLSAQVEAHRVADTQRRLAEIQEALLGFAAARGRLPCPALAATATGSPGAGLEPDPVQAEGCASPSGVLPWATLGVAETDAWGNRYTYRVAPEFARTATAQTIFKGDDCPPPSNPRYAAFALCSEGNLKAYSTAGGSTVADEVPAVVISHGRNGSGAYTPQGRQVDAGADADERDNQLTGTGTTMANVNFVAKTATATYDDLVVWVSPNLLMNRMITAGKLP